MSNNNWSRPTDWDTVCRRNAGRRHYNAVRQFLRLRRRGQLVALLNQHHLLLCHRGTQARLARELGVSRTTVCRDVQFLLTLNTACPCCGALVPRERVER